MIFGAVLILVGGWFLTRRYLPFLDGDFLGPVVLVLIGVLLIGGAVLRSGGKDGTPASGARAPASRHRAVIPRI